MLDGGADSPSRPPPIPSPPCCEDGDVGADSLPLPTVLSRNHCSFCRPLLFWCAKTSCLPRPWTTRWKPYRSWSLPPSLAGWDALRRKREVDLGTAAGFHSSFGLCVCLGRPGHHQLPRRRTRKHRRCCHPGSGPPRRTRRPGSLLACFSRQDLRLTLPTLVTITGVLPGRENRLLWGGGNVSGYMGPSYMPCCYNSARFAQNAHCVTRVTRGWTKVPASYCFWLKPVPSPYAAKA